MTQIIFLKKLFLLVCFLILTLGVGIWSAVFAISAHGDQKRALSPLELKLQMVVSHHVAAGTKLCKSSQCF